jgi:hypothetical protein
MLPPQNLENERIPEHIKVISGIFPKTEHFKFTKNYHHLDPIRKDEIYATDGDKEYKVKENTVMLLPFKKIRPNQEAGYIGKIVE